MSLSSRKSKPKHASSLHLSRAKDDIISGWRSFLIREWEREVDIIVAVQKYRNPVLDIFFFIVSLLGDEIFYISFLPFCIWCWGYTFGVHMAILMSCNITVGNIFKNLLSLPRPASPPVWINSAPQLDHGMPSTHTMSGVAIPFYYIYYFYVDHPGDNSVSFSVAVALGVVWTLSVAFSRIYNGHHSPMDVGLGAIIAFAILFFFIGFLRHIADQTFVTPSVLAPLGWYFCGMFILYLHYTPHHPTPAYGESGLALGTGVGAVVGGWSINTFGLPTAVWPELRAAPSPLVAMLRHTGAIWLVRFLIGVTIVLLMRLLAKKIFVNLVKMFIFPPPTKTKDISSESELKKKLLAHLHPHPRSSHIAEYTYSTPQYHHPKAEVIVKYMTYINISMAVVVWAPIILNVLGLGAAADYPVTPAPAYIANW